MLLLKRLVLGVMPLTETRLQDLLGLGVANFPIRGVASIFYLKLNGDKFYVNSLLKVHG